MEEEEAVRPALAVAVAVVQASDALQRIADDLLILGHVSCGASAKSVSRANRRVGSGLDR